MHFRVAFKKSTKRRSSKRKLKVPIKFADSICNMNGRILDNKLNLRPTQIDENGNEIVVFDEDLVAVGSINWKHTLHGQFGV